MSLDVSFPSDKIPDGLVRCILRFELDYLRGTWSQMHWHSKRAMQSVVVHVTLTVSERCHKLIFVDICNIFLILAFKRSVQRVRATGNAKLGCLKTSFSAPLFMLSVFYLCSHSILLLHFIHYRSQCQLLHRLAHDCT